MSEKYTSETIHKLHRPMTCSCSRESLRSQPLAFCAVIRVIAEVASWRANQAQATHAVCAILCIVAFGTRVPAPIIWIKVGVVLALSAGGKGGTETAIVVALSTLTTHAVDGLNRVFTGGTALVALPGVG